ncbi:hypothetical protein CHS0354_000534 [Potamilus streckersoni]|uniref:Glutamyl-tRNA(Gln) amidotransferase subunit B, mitochondrial n=1 Tax=Potamilus streckersoni TaxID=2493646 RepID=A0AAE0T744_9BIVA|nr:hypothetical protein CHS0354_000534 [Potamilus streckersoni]
MNEFEIVIGLEVHCQLNTKTKAFCSCPTTFGVPPNESVCPVCLALPGALPVLNQQVVFRAVKLGMAFNCRILPQSWFARKNYFYPDLPKGYQISQSELPICLGGSIKFKLDNEWREVKLIRIHIEEDAGKSVHDIGTETYIDINRSGVPLLEIVSEPDIRSSNEAKAYLERIRQIVRYFDISDGNMEEGSLRCDANVSLRKKSEKKFGTRTEIKNMNSFKSVEKAIDFEVQRQYDILKTGGTIIQETRLWDANKEETRSMRGKEDAHDYRYFPEPDLVPIHVPDTLLSKIKKSLPELPEQRAKRFVDVMKIPEYDAQVITSDKHIADYYESVAQMCGNAKIASNWVMGEVLKSIKERNMDIAIFPIQPTRLAKLISLVIKSVISNTIAKEVFELMMNSEEMPEELIEKNKLSQVSDFSVLEAIVNKVLSENSEHVNAYKSGECVSPEPIKYTVTFDSKGGTSVGSVTVTSGSKVTKPKEPTRAGYDFDGWYKEEASTNVFNFDTETIKANIILYAKWAENSYTVTFNSNGGSTVPNAKVTHGSKVAKPIDPSRVGYAFGGWYKEEASTNVFNFDTETIKANIILYAKWAENSYTVTFNSNEGSAVPEAIVKYGSKVTKPTDPSRVGYAFGGWYKEAALTNVFNFGTETITANITLYAKWTINTYTVTFNTGDGSTVPEATVDYGGNVTKPTDPTRVGYAFGGWYKEVGLTNAFNFDTETITANITLYAKWAENSYTVTFNSNGGSTVPNVTVDYGSKVTKPTDPTREGHAFGGWYKEAGFINKFIFDTETITANIILYAKWAENSYTVTFNTGDGSTVPAATVNHGNKVTKPTDPTRVGYAFGGWYKEVLLTNVFSFTTETITANIILYAKWTINTYTVTFNTGDGSPVPAATVNHGNKVTKPTDPTRVGYAFGGWYKEVGLTNAFNFTTETITASITLYAKWAENSYTVTFNTGDGSTVEDIIVIHGGKVTKPTDPTREGHVFGGWYKEVLLTNVFNFDTETITANIILYAKWTINTYTVTFNTGDGSPVPAATVNHGNKVTKPTDPTRVGYAFGGWYKEEASTNVFNFDTETITASITLYAKWAENSYTVTFNTGDGSPVPAATVNHGNKVTKPTDPTREGHVFGGWYKEVLLTNVFNFDTETITANIILYAKWTINTYTVTFNSNSGSTVPEATVNHGNKVTKPTDPTRVGYAFGGWYKEVLLTNVFNFDTETITANVTLYAKWTINTYTITFNTGDGSPVPAATVNHGNKVTKPTEPTREETITANIILYAKWTINTYTVTFNTGDGSTVPDVTVNHGEKVTKPTDPTRVGYAFGGWYKEEASTNVFNFDTETITANIILYAKWTINTYTIMFNTGDGSPVPAATVNHGNKVTKPTDPTREETITANITLYAKWTINTYTVTFNTGDGSTVPAATVTHGSRVTKPTDPTRTGYTFGGWYKEVGLTNAFNFDTETITVNITLYAKWTINTYTVTFNSNSGSIVPNATVNHGSRVAKPTDPTRTGYTFGGWYKEVGLTNAFDFGIEIITASITLYVKWLPILVTSITFDKTGPLATFIGETNQITATILPLDALTKTLTWTSSNDDVATVDANGLITTHAKGDAIITATSTDGSNISASINIDPYFYVPDKNFREALKNISTIGNLNWFTTVDGRDALKIEDAKVTGEKSMYLIGKEIESLVGIEYFTSLEELLCGENKLQTLDVSKNVALKTLSCAYNDLRSLDLSKNVALTTLYILHSTNSTYPSNPNLTFLDLRGMRSVDPNGGLGIVNGINILETLLLHDNLKTHTGVRDAKTARGNNLIISTYSADAGSSVYTKTCSNWDPGTSGTGNCTKP